MKDYKTKSSEYVAKVFNDRLKELGMSRYRFLKIHDGDINAPTLRRVFRGDGSTSLSTISHYCDLLGLEIKIIKKESES